MSLLASYALNGIDVDDNDYDWVLLAVSSPLPGIANRVQSLIVGGQDGNIPVPMSEDSPVITLVIRVPFETNETFLALCDAAALTLTHDSYSAAVELLTVSAADLGMDYVDYAVVLRFSGMAWRDPSVSTSAAAAISTTPIAVSILSGISAPVRDAIVRVAGSVTGLRVTDTQGSYFEYLANIPSGSYLRFEAATGRAFVTTTNTWVGGTEVTSSIDYGPGPYFLSLTPKFTTPETRAAGLTVTTTARASSPTIEVRAAGAYRV